MNAVAGDKPLIGVTPDVKTIDGQPFHAVGNKYLRALGEAADAMPFILPALGSAFTPAMLLERLDGLLLTGSLSNVHPRRYGAPASAEHEPYDEDRDELTFRLIEHALDAGLPLLAICRGFQELNAALGGTLHPAVHGLDGRLDHRAPDVDDPDVKYGPRHPVRFRAGGPFATLAGGEAIQVNSLHRQAIDRLSPRLRVEGVAPDGTIEAVSVSDAAGFALGVQWHPEYRAIDDAFSCKLFGAFGRAARERARTRTRTARRNR